MKHFTVAFSVLLAVGFSVSGADKNPTTLKNEFTAALPAGYMAKVAWTQSHVAGGKLIIHVVSSVDGIIHEVSPSTSSAGNPQVTADGSKVIYQNYDLGQLWVVNWDGTGGKSFYNSGSALEDYWYDATNKIDYAVTYEGEINAATGKMGRSWPGGGGDDGLHISPDGKYLASGWNGWEVYNIATGVYTARGQGGCVCNLSPDTKYSVMVQQSGHTSEGVSYADGTFKTFSVTADIRAKVAGGNDACTDAPGEFQETRWPHPDYITFPVGGLKANPFLVSLTTPTKWVAMQDNEACFVPQYFMGSSVGARILPATGINAPAKETQAAVSAGVNLGTARCESYLPDGRRVDAAALVKIKGQDGIRGVVITRAQGGQAGALKTVVLP